METLLSESIKKAISTIGKTCYTDKILKGLVENLIITEEEFISANRNLIDMGYICDFTKHVKIHDIVHDPQGEFNGVKKIRFRINDIPEENYELVSPVPLISTQKIIFRPFEKQIEIEKPKNGKSDITEFRKMKNSEIELLSKNNGFETVKELWNLFNEPIEVKLIHWTDFKY